MLYKIKYLKNEKNYLNENELNYIKKYMINLLNNYDYELNKYYYKKENEKLKNIDLKKLIKNLKNINEIIFYYIKEKNIINIEIYNNKIDRNIFNINIKIDNEKNYNKEYEKLKIKKDYILFNL